MSKANKTKKPVDALTVSCPFCKSVLGTACNPEGRTHFSRIHSAEIQVALDRRDAKIYLQKEAA